jgi:hypothetical protein
MLLPLPLLSTVSVNKFIPQCCLEFQEECAHQRC